MEHQIHYGRKFYLDKQNGYWISTTYPRTRAHIWVWQQFNGMKVPKDFHIHHVDENKSNNDISNLMLIHKRQHAKLHYSEEDRLNARIMADKYRHLTKEWHSSPEGLEWHREHAIKNGFGNWDKVEYTCEICSKKFMSQDNRKVKFCSNNCKSMHRRRAGLDRVDRTCVICLELFQCNKYNKTVTCGRKCGSILCKKTKGLL